MDTFEKISRSPEPSSYEEMISKSVGVNGEVAGVDGTSENVSTQQVSSSNDSPEKYLESLNAKFDGLQSWNNKIESGLFLAAVLSTFYLTYGPEGYGLLSLMLTLLLFRVLSLFALSSALKALEERKEKQLEPLILLLGSANTAARTALAFPSSNTVSKLLLGSAALIETRINKFSAFVDRATQPAKEGLKAFKGVAAHLVVPLVVLRFVSLYNCVFVWIIYKLTWPALYQKYQEPIDTLYMKSRNSAAPHFKVVEKKWLKFYPNFKKKADKASSVVGAALRPVGTVALSVVGKFVETDDKKTN